MTPQRVPDSATDSTAMTTNEIDPADETGTERPRNDLEEHVPPYHETDLLQVVPYTTPQQVSAADSASDPASTTKEIDPGGATGTESSRDDHKEHGIDTGDETGQGEGDEEKISPSQETVMLQPKQHMTPHHDTDGHSEYFNPTSAGKILCKHASTFQWIGSPLDCTDGEYCSHMNAGNVIPFV